MSNAVLLIVASPDPLNLRQMVDTARTLNQGIEIVLRKESIGAIFFGEEELA